MSWPKFGRGDSRIRERNATAWATSLFIFLNWLIDANKKCSTHREYIEPLYARRTQAVPPTETHSCAAIGSCLHTGRSAVPGRVALHRACRDSQKPDSVYSTLLEHEALYLTDRYNVQEELAASIFKVERNVCTCVPNSTASYPQSVAMLTLTSERPSHEICDHTASKFSLRTSEWNKLIVCIDII